MPSAHSAATTAQPARTHGRARHLAMPIAAAAPQRTARAPLPLPGRTAPNALGVESHRGVKMYCGTSVEPDALEGAVEPRYAPVTISVANRIVRW